MTTPNDDTVDRQDEHEAIIRAELAKEDETDRTRFAVRGATAVPTTVATASATYTAAELQSALDALAAIRTALRSSGIIA